MSRNDARRATARTLIARSNADGWTPWQLASAIAEECGCTLLQAHRLGRDWTLAVACDRLADLGARVSVQQLSAWETGRGRPGEANLDHLCRLYETRPDRLGYGRDYTPADESTVTLALTSPEPEPAGPAGETSTRSVPADLSVTPPTRTGLSYLAAVRRGMTTVLQAPLAETTIEQWERQATEYGHAYQLSPPAQLLSDSITDFLELRALLEQRQPAENRARLCRTAGIALVALGEHREARHWYHLGQLLAEETGDRALRAWLLAREAVIPFYFGAPAAALALAERARLVAGSTVCATAAWAPALEARALARMGRAREAQDAMTLAERAFARLTNVDTSDTAYGYTERQLVWHGGSMWAALGDTRRAQGALQSARELYAPGEHLDRALITMDEATSLVGVGEISVACRETEMLLLGLPREHRTGIVISRARELLAAVPPRGCTTAPVRDLRDLVESSTRPELTA
jgi:transcriptional regulator with XRE-family HTH domain/tetratricopeptide (TPR) repeat protein